MADNSFLQDFRIRMLSSRWAMSRSIILRFSIGLPAEHKILVLTGEKTIGFQICILSLNLEKKENILRDM